MWCFYCNCVLRRKGWKRRTRDHVVPKCHSHFHSLTQYQHMLNVVECCYHCNNRKGGLHPLMWMKHVPKDQRQRVAERLLALGFASGVIALALDKITDATDLDVRLVSAPGT